MMRQSTKKKKGFEILDELMPELNEKPSIYLEDREASWGSFISDIEAAKKIIHIDIPIVDFLVQNLTLLVLVWILYTFFYDMPLL